MKREKHKANVKSRILQAAKESFQEKGYSKTPITEIMKKAKVSNGTLYHFFKNKEDILLHLTREMIDLTIDLADGISKDTHNPWLNFYIEIAMQFSLALFHPNIAEMYLIAHESGMISKEITDRIQERSLFLFRHAQPDIEGGNLYPITLTVKGLIHSFIQMVFYSDQPPDPDLAFKALDLVLNLFQIPEVVKTRTITQAHTLFRRHPDIFYGLKPSADQ